MTSESLDPAFPLPPILVKLLALSLSAPEYMRTRIQATERRTDDVDGVLLLSPDTRVA